ncbi:MAG TPA: DEAD/DEAH box helicase [Candidatus Baltobacteraceae bacterium]|nr:DEAD/DEAH box helicase [Candidatus Baltobacteraceae bacterium]
MTRVGFAHVDGADAQETAQLAAAGLPNRGASPMAWARFRYEGVPALERAGWDVEIDESLYDLFVDLSAPSAIWDARLESRAGDWFDLDLGVEIEGKRVPLLPLVVDVLRGMERGTLPQGEVAFANVDGRVVVLPMDRIRRVLETLVELHEDPQLTRRGKLALGSLAALNIAQALPELQGSDERAQMLGRLAQHLRSFDGVPQKAIPHELRATLRDYQHEGYRWLQFLREFELGGILADDMGLGKSVQAIAHLLATPRLHSAPLAPHLLVVPTSLVPNWLAEIERFAPSLRVLTLHGPARERLYARIDESDVVITTYALLVRDEIFSEREWDVAILDEAQAIKNPQSKVARTAAKIRAKQRICLTGTPMENHLGELWSLFNFVMPHALYDQRTFARLFRTPIEKQNSFERRDMLARRIRPFVLRRTKAGVALQLPEKIEIVERVELAADQRDLYESVRIAVQEEVRREIERLGLARSRIAVLDALLKLRQVCCDPRLVKLASAARAHSSVKLEWLVETLEQLVEEGRHALVFSQFTSMIDLIKPELERAGIPYVELVGSTADRATPVRRFQSGEVPVFLISLRAGGTGLNLTAADTVILYDPWWNPAVEQQAMDRAHRIGQDKAVFVYKVVAAGTVEEKILQLQARKAELAGALFDAADASTLDLRPEDVEALFS